MMGEIFALRRLRWKLTLSYTLVAAVTLLALELILAGALVAFLNSDLLPRLVVQNFRDEVAPRLERPLNQNPPDTRAIREKLTGFADRSGVRGADRPPPPPTDLSNYTADQAPSSWSTTNAVSLSPSPRCKVSPKASPSTQGGSPALSHW